MTRQLDLHDGVAVREEVALSVPPRRIAEPSVNEHECGRAGARDLVVNARAVRRDCVVIHAVGAYSVIGRHGRAGHAVVKAGHAVMHSSSRVRVHVSVHA